MAAASNTTSLMRRGAFGPARPPAVRMTLPHFTVQPSPPSSAPNRTPLSSLRGLRSSSPRGGETPDHLVNHLSPPEGFAQESGLQIRVLDIKSQTCPRALDIGIESLALSESPVSQPNHRHPEGEADPKDLSSSPPSLITLHSSTGSSSATNGKSFFLRNIWLRDERARFRKSGRCAALRAGIGRLTDIADAPPPLQRVTASAEGRAKSFLADLGEWRHTIGSKVIGVDRVPGATGRRRRLQRRPG